MEILHILNLDTIGGVEELFIHFLEEAVKTQPHHQHHLLVTGGPIHPFFEETVHNYASSIRYEKYLFGIKVPKVVRQLHRKFFTNKQKFTHIVLWNRLETVKARCPVIYYEHGASWIAPQEVPLDPIFSQATTILANSYAAKRLLELKWNLTAPITVIENPLRPDLVIKTEPRTLPSKPIHLGYIGRLIPLKGVALAIHALHALLKQHSAATLSIAGQGSERKKLEALTKELGLEQSIRFLGNIDNISGFYDSIDLLILPSIREPLGLVALEAACRGCPVIAAKVDGLPEAVMENESGLLISPSLSISQYASFGGSATQLPDLVYNPLHNRLEAPQLVDPENIASTVAALVKNPEEYQRLSQGALTAAKKRADFAGYTKCFMKALAYTQTAVLRNPSSMVKNTDDTGIDITYPLC